MPLWRRAAITIVVVFVIYSVITDPVKSANVTADAWDHLSAAVVAIGVFLNVLINR